MFAKIVRNDLLGSKLISLTVFAFILCASFLAATVGLVAVNLNASIDAFLDKAQPPHFIQMHMGDFDPDRMQTFAQSQENVLAYQTLPFLNVEAGDILVNGEVFSENSQDKGFSVQSDHFDFLLDLEDKVAYPEKGEIYIPLVYASQKLIEVGDRMTLGGQDFIVKGAVRDAQMSSMLSSSKRFILHPEDYEKIRPVGREEFLIEFLLKDPTQVDSFQGAYAQAELESNGPTITYAIIKLINALTDGIMIAILSLVAFIIVIVSFLCIRMTLIAKIEDEYETIGVLKAIGIRLSLIKRMYRAKYALISLVACLGGFLLSLAFSGIFLQNIRLFFGDNESGLAGFLGAFLATCLIFVFVMAYINRFLRRLKKLSPAGALHQGVLRDGGAGFGALKLRQQGLLPANVFLGLNMVMKRKKTYATFVAILLMTSFLMVLPHNIHASLASEKFINYMGLGDADMIMTLPDRKDLKDLEKDLKKDPEMVEYAFYDHKSYPFLLDEDNLGKVWVTLGDHQKFPVFYTAGQAPEKEREISLSHLQASSLDKTVGDTMTLILDGERKEVTICGIYSDTTNGGKTARASFSHEAGPSLSTSLLMTFAEGTDLEEKAQVFAAAYPQAKVTPVVSYREDVFGSTLQNIRKSALTSLILSLGLSFLISLLFINMLIAKDRRPLAVFKSLGFTSKNLGRQYMVGALLLGIVSMLIGMVLVNTLGQTLAGGFLEAMGIANFRFVMDKGFGLCLAPLCLLASVGIGTYLASLSIRDIKVADMIRGS